MALISELEITWIESEKLTLLIILGALLVIVGAVLTTIRTKK